MAVVTDLSKIYKWINDPGFWALDYEKLVSRNALISFVFGEKSLGKTYGAIEYIWKHYCSTGRRFLFLRRREDETKANALPMWNDYFKKNGIDKEVFIEEKYRVMIRDKSPDFADKDERKDWEKKHPSEVFGFANSLDNVQTLQGMHLDDYDVDTIFLDEFMLYNTQKRLIPDEAETLQTAIKNTFRFNTLKYQCHVFAMSNTGYMTNPYFIAYGVTPQDFDNATYVWRGDTLFVACPPSGNYDPFSNAYTKSFTDFANSAKFLDDSGDMVLKQPPRGSRTLFSMVDGLGSTFVVQRLSDGRYYVKDKITSAAQVYAFDQLHTIPGAVYSKRVIELLKMIIADNKLFFESAMVRNLFMERM